MVGQISRPAFQTVLALGYAATVFAGAFLLFLVQPLLGKFILPWFGGSPAVWTTAMLVFQVLLFGGYFYAHLLARLPLRWQATLHAGLLLVSLATLPIAPSAAWKPSESESPALHIIWLLTACVGLPYFLLSSTGPLIQSWHGRSHVGQPPYRLYALSNAGSLLALLAYPFLVERFFSKTAQSTLWSAGFGGFVILCSGCAVLAWRSVGGVSSRQDAFVDETTVETPSPNRVSNWFGLAATASVLLLAVTNQVCLDVAVVPFLWVVPLGLYLLTFILCFDGERWYRREVFGPLALFSLALACWLAFTASSSPLVFQLLVYFTALFASCMVCHGELVQVKPHPRYLTLFYLTISAGGAAGGAFVALLAPLLFSGYFELYLGALTFCLLFMAVARSESHGVSASTIRFVAATVLLCGLGLSYWGPRMPGTITVSRNFYGVLRVEESRNQATGEPQVALAHGGVIHGVQFATSTKRLWPTAYYGRRAGIGRVLATHRAGAARHIGVVGLGIGTLAAYGQPSDQFRIYEINPDVIAFAKRHFTFLKECRSETQIIVGDARLMLEREEPQQFDVLVLDAFSGDAIPVHLLTREAGEVYLRHLKPDGVLACHITNIHFDLQPVLTGLAEEFDLARVNFVDQAEPNAGTFTSTWVLLSRDQSALNASVGSHESVDSHEPPITWTDDRNNLFDVLADRAVK